MPCRKNTFFPGGFFHIYNRGINHERIFFFAGDYRYCISLIKKYSVICDISIIAFCLMPNHYHLVLRQNSDKSVSQFIGVVFNAYVQGLNKKHGRNGTLFQGRFKDVHIDEENYILQLCRYLHLNPVKAMLVEKPEEWPFSDYNDWIGKRIFAKVDIDFSSSYFRNPNDYQQYVMEYKMSEDQKDIQEYLLE